MNFRKGAVLLSVGTYSHRALFYDTDDDLVAGLVPFVAAGIERNERVVVVVGAATGLKLRRQLGPRAEFDLWDANDVYTSPVRTLAAYVDTVASSTEEGRCIRVAGEPVWVGRSPLELVEWTCVEAACNVVFADSNLEMLCPYNTSVLDPAIIAAARRTHPHIQRGSAVGASSAFAPVEHQSSVRASSLPPRAAGFERISIASPVAFSSVMASVEAFGRAKGMARTRLVDFCVAVRHLIEDLFEYGVGRAQLNVWTTAEDLVCEVEIDSAFASPFAGYLPESQSAPFDAGLWHAGQKCDLLAVRELEGNSTVRMQFSDYLTDVRPECGGVDHLLGVYVLGSCEVAELAFVEGHLHNCVQCMAEVERLRDVVHRLGSADHHEAHG